MSDKKKKRVIVKGYMRPDKTSYYVVIPKPIRELLGLKGGEYFMMKAEVEDKEIELKLVEFEEDMVSTENQMGTIDVEKESSQ